MYVFFLFENKFTLLHFTLKWVASSMCLYIFMEGLMLLFENFFITQSKEKSTSHPKRAMIKPAVFPNCFNKQQVLQEHNSISKQSKLELSESTNFPKSSLLEYSNISETCKPL